jgi:uncharacterized protein YecT (DUF1311 family)
VLPGGGGCIRPSDGAAAVINDSSSGPKVRDAAAWLAVRDRECAAVAADHQRVIQQRDTLARA